MSLALSPSMDLLMSSEATQPSVASGCHAFVPTSYAEAMEILSKSPSRQVCGRRVQGLEGGGRVRDSGHSWAKMPSGRGVDSVADEGFQSASAHVREASNSWGLMGVVRAGEDCLVRNHCQV